MTAKEFDKVKECAEQEGFDYCFRHYSAFPEIRDEAFHKLRVAYIHAAEDLSDYLNLEEE